ncbi:MAG: hypothetical protein EOP52_13515 [Sphingobacteriales bacterium]|nr:MAG: hypothetical protein EOP52_13515 [Sphingobacteriales bacterium]
MELRIYLRQYQNLDEFNRAVVYSGPRPASVIATFGTVPVPDWVEVTEACSGRDELALTWSQLQGNISDDPKQNRIQKATSSTLTFETAAYALLREWLVDHVAAALHQIEVKIVHVGCGEYLGFTIKTSQLSWCEDGLCTFEVTMAQQDAYMDCIRKTVISDNWQGWFQSVPKNGKKHPRFSYCNEERPNAKLIIVWYVTQQIMVLSYIIFTLMYPVLLIIFTLINVINDILDWIGWDPIGGTNHFDVPDYGDLSDFFMNMFIESAGCGREHPAPLIRDYITNVCDKCGVRVTPDSAPVFFSKSLDVHTSEGTKNIQNPYFNACYLTATVARGIRRTTSRSPFFGVQNANTDYYIEDNAPLEALDMFLDKLKGLYNLGGRLKAGLFTSSALISSTIRYRFSISGRMGRTGIRFWKASASNGTKPACLHTEKGCTCRMRSTPVATRPCGSKMATYVSATPKTICSSLEKTIIPRSTSAVPVSGSTDPVQTTLLTR